VADSFQPGLHRFAALTAGVTLLLLVAGALVTSNGVGLAVPDWPLSYGTLMPPMVGGVAFEHGHRMVAGTVLILTVILAVWLARREPRAWVRRLGWLGLAAVLAQALLGGLTVLLGLPRIVSIAHAALAQLFFCTVVSIALFTSRAWREEIAVHEEAEASPLRTAAFATCGAVFVQLLLGAGFRHGAFGILPHLLGAAVVATLGYRTAAVAREHYRGVAPLAAPARWLGWLITAQLVLGGGALWSRIAFAGSAQPARWMIGLTVAHVALGAATFAAAVVLAAWSHRVLKPAGKLILESKAPGVLA